MGAGSFVGNCASSSTNTKDTDKYHSKRILLEIGILGKLIRDIRVLYVEYEMGKRKKLDLPS